MILDYAQRLIITQTTFSGAVVISSPTIFWQNYFINTKTSDGYEYKSFTCSTFANGIQGETGNFTIEFPYTRSVEQQLLQFSNNKALIRAETMQLTSANVSGNNFTRSTLISAYVGRIEEFSTNLTTITLGLINAIDLATAYAPPRKITASLVKGVPSTLRQSF